MKNPTVRAERITDKERLDWFEAKAKAYRNEGDRVVMVDKFGPTKGRFTIKRDTVFRTAKRYPDIRSAIDAAIRSERRKPNGRKPQ